jgi:hypothetical protein
VMVVAMALRIWLSLVSETAWVRLGTPRLT